MGPSEPRQPGSRAPRKPLRCGCMRIPTDDDVLRLHKKYAPTPDAFDLVYTHCQIICGIARQLHSRPGADQDIDMDLVQAGSLLHDIGVYRLYDDDGKLDRTDYIRHG